MYLRHTVLFSPPFHLFFWRVSVPYLRPNPKFESRKTRPSESHKYVVPQFWTYEGLRSFHGVYCIVGTHPSTLPGQETSVVGWSLSYVKYLSFVKSRFILIHTLV